jgi:trimeric autotransporter adhesin
MGSNAAKLAQLRPVTFHFKSDPRGVRQYGLIAEEVAKVYPELVIRGGNGRIDGVRYDELAPMLLKEVQDQQQVIAAQDARNAAQGVQIEGLKQLIATHTEQLQTLQQQLNVLQAALRAPTRKDEWVAQR